MFNNLCNPAKLYAVLFVITLISSVFNGISIMTLAIKLIFAIIWIVVLNYICGSGFIWFSWLLVLLPFVLLIFGTLGLMKMVQSQQLLRSMQLK